MTLLWISAALMILTAVAHSLIGEKRLIGPLLSIDHPTTQRPLARQLIRFAWHFTSLFMLLTAALVVWPGIPRNFILLTGILWLAVGLFDLVYTRGKHLGWPLLSLAGLFAFLGAVV